MATGTITTTTTIAPPVNYVLQAELLARANQKCVYPSVCVPGEYMKHGGSNFTIKWRRYEQQTPTTTPLAELTGSVAFPTRASSTPTISDITATLAKYGDYFLLNEESDFTNVTPQNGELMAVLGEQAGRSLNRLARDEMEDNLTQRRVGGASVTADNQIVSPMTRNAIAGTVAVLNTNSARKRFPDMTGGSTNVGTAPIFESFIGIAHTYVAEDITRLAGFVPVQSYSSQVKTLPGEIGYTPEVRWLRTEEASQNANTGGAAGNNISTAGVSADLFDSIIVGESAVGSVGLNMREPDKVYEASEPPATVELIHKPRGQGGIVDPFNELETMAWKVWAVFKIVNSTWGRRVTSTATAYA